MATNTSFTQTGDHQVRLLLISATVPIADEHDLAVVNVDHARHMQICVQMFDSEGISTVAVAGTFDIEAATLCNGILESVGSVDAKTPRTFKCTLGVNRLRVCPNTMNPGPVTDYRVVATFYP